jgi:hypothetical protein
MHGDSFADKAAATAIFRPSGPSPQHGEQFRQPAMLLRLMIKHGIKPEDA